MKGVLASLLTCETLKKVHVVDLKFDSIGVEVELQSDHLQLLLQIQETPGNLSLNSFQMMTCLQI